MATENKKETSKFIEWLNKAGQSWKDFWDKPVTIQYAYNPHTVVGNGGAPFSTTQRRGDFATQTAAAVAIPATAAGVATVGVVPTLVGMGAGMGAGIAADVGGSKLVELVGGDENAQEMVGDIAGFIAGAVAGGGTTRRAYLAMPNLRTSVYNRVNPYSYSGHAKELGQLAKDNLLYTALLGKRIKPLSYIDKMDRVDMTPYSLDNISRDLFFRDRLGIPFDITTYQNSSKGLISPNGKNWLHSELPYILDATAKDGTNIYHFNPEYLTTPFRSLRLENIRTTLLPRRNVDIFTGAGGRVGSKLKNGQIHMYDRWNTRPFEHTNKMPLLFAKLINNRPFLKKYIHPHIKNFDPIEIISVRPAPIQYNVKPIGLNDPAIFDVASKNYNIQNAADIVSQIHKSGGTIHIKKKNKGKFTDYCGGKVTEECIRKGKNSSNPTTRKRANFAWVARHKFKHEEGGKINYLNIF